MAGKTPRRPAKGKSDGSGTDVRRAGMWRTFLFAGLVFSCIAGAGLFHAWLRVEGLQLGYRRSEVTGEYRRLLKEQERLKLEVATLEAPARIERLARTTLGMRPPKAGQVIVIPEPTPVAEPAPAQHAAAEGKKDTGILGAVVEVIHGP